MNPVSSQSSTSRSWFNLMNVLPISNPFAGLFSSVRDPSPSEGTIQGSVVVGKAAEMVMPQGGAVAGRVGRVFGEVFPFSVMSDEVQGDFEHVLWEEVQGDLDGLFSCKEHVCAGDLGASQLMSYLDATVGPYDRVFSVSLDKNTKIAVPKQTLNEFTRLGSPDELYIGSLKSAHPPLNHRELRTLWKMPKLSGIEGVPNQQDAEGPQVKAILKDLLRLAQGDFKRVESWLTFCNLRPKFALWGHVADSIQKTWGVNPILPRETGFRSCKTVLDASTQNLICEVEGEIEQASGGAGFDQLQPFRVVFKGSLLFDAKTGRIIQSVEVQRVLKTSADSAPAEACEKKES